MNRYHRPPAPRKYRKKGWILFLMILGLATASVLYFWDSRQPTEEGETLSTPPAPHKPTLDRPRVVVFLPLSGPFQQEGHSLREGIELGWDELEGEGFQGEMIMEDVNGEDFNVAGAAQALAADPHNVALIAHVPSLMLEKLIPLCEKHHMVLIAPASSHESLADHDSVITLVSSDGAEAFQGGQAVSRMGFSRVAAIHDSTPFGKLLSERFKEGAMEAGLEVQELAASCDATLFSRSIAHALAADLVFLAGSPVWGVEAAGILSQQGYEGKVMVPQVYDRFILEDLHEHYKGRLLVMRAPLQENGHDASFGQFMHKFVAAHLREPDWLAALGYDTIKWLQEDLQRDPLRREEFKNSLMQRFTAGQTFSGASGKVSFGSHGEAARELDAFYYEKGDLLPAMESRSRSSAMETAFP